MRKSILLPLTTWISKILAFAQGLKTKENPRFRRLPLDPPRYLVWHPSVHAQFGDELVFVFLKVTAFPKEDVYERLEAFLGKSKHTAYRIYRILGAVDIVLRVWVERGRSEEFISDLQRQVDYVESAIQLTVAEIPHHWQYWRTATATALSSLGEDSVTALQKCFDKPETWGSAQVSEAVNSFLVRPVTESNGTIMFFTSLLQSGARRFDQAYLLKEIYALFDQYKDGLQKTAVYRTRGEYAYLIKCETRDFFLIGAFVNELSHRIAGHRCGIATSIVCEYPIRGREEIGKRSFRQIERRDIATSTILPELYDDPSVTANMKSEIEGWVRKYLVPHRHEITEEDFKVIQSCLRAVVIRDEGAFLAKIVEVFGRAERSLRSLTGKFIGLALGPSTVHSTIQDALKHLPGAEQRKIEFISLGDRLAVIAYAIKQANLSEDPDIVGGWSREVTLRDRAAHFSEQTFAEWSDELATLLQFFGRYRKLIELVGNTCKA